MNLNRIAGAAIAAINPRTVATLRRSIGSTTNADGSRTPLYAPDQRVLCQVQPIQGTDLAQLDGLNLQGTKRKIYVNAHWDGVIRSQERGGDLIIIPHDGTYLVITVLETWRGWSAVAATLQDGP